MGLGVLLQRARPLMLRATAAILASTTAGAPQAAIRKDQTYAHASGDHTNFQVYGSCASANNPISVRPTPSSRSHACTSCRRTKSGNPDSKPVKAHTIMRRFKTSVSFKPFDRLLVAVIVEG